MHTNISHAEDRSKALRRVRPPAVALIVAGVLVIVGGCILSAVVTIMVALDRLHSADDIEQSRQLIAFAVVGLSGFTALAAGCLMIVGGFRMFHLRARRLALVAAVVALLSALGFAFGGVLSVFGWAGIPAGLWALVVLREEVVRQSFD